MFDAYDFPWIGGTGALHDLDDQDPPPMLWGLKSVSKVAARALDRRTPPATRVVGFAGRLPR